MILPLSFATHAYTTSLPGLRARALITRSDIKPNVKSILLAALELHSKRDLDNVQY